MRLINANELIKEFDRNKEIDDSNEYKGGINTGIYWCIADVLDAPTVEAIPVKWLKENYGNLQIIRYIMKDWEIENESKK